MYFQHGQAAILDKYHPISIDPQSFGGRLCGLYAFHTFSPKEITMPQSFQDDTFDELATFAEGVFICMSLKAMKSSLNDEEIYLLDRSAGLLRLFPSPVPVRVPSYF
jgi:hypothetical protein